MANGIKARVALTMHKWSDAYKAAEEALKGYAGSEALDASQITGGMNDITALPSVMWGEVKTTDNYGMYLSFRPRWTLDTTAMPRRPAAAALRGFGTA